MSSPNEHHPLTLAQRRQRDDLRNLTLWTMQGWLAMFFLAAGYAKASQPMESLVVLLSWAADDQEIWVRSLGGLEIGLGLAPMAPLFLGARGRTPLLIGVVGLAALTGVMILVHGLQQEAGAVVLNVILLALSLAVAAGRWHRPKPSP